MSLSAVMVMVLCLSPLISDASAVKMAVQVELATQLSQNGVAGFSRVLGFSAYGGAWDFARNESSTELQRGRAFLRHTGADAIGIMSNLPGILPSNSSQSLASLKALETYLNSSQPQELFNVTDKLYPMLSRGVLRAFQSEPYVYLDNYCEPSRPHSICPHGGSPNATDYEWFAALLTAYSTYANQADEAGGGPGLRYVHIFNEPNAHYWVTHRNVTDYVNMFLTASRRLHRELPNISVGGPVIYDGPAETSYRAPRWQSWTEWAKPFIDATASTSQLDFLDFHSYNASAVPSELESSVLLVNSYARSAYNWNLRSAITETNYCILNTSAVNYTEAYVHRARHMAKAILRLWRHPDKVISRHTFDYGADVHCAYNVRGPGDLGNPFSATADMYHLMGAVAGTGPGQAVAVRLDVRTSDASEEAHLRSDGWDDEYQPYAAASLRRMQSGPHGSSIDEPSQWLASVLIMNPSDTDDAEVTLSMTSNDLVDTADGKYVNGTLLLPTSGLQPISQADLPSWPTGSLRLPPGSMALLTAQVQNMNEPSLINYREVSVNDSSLFMKNLTTSKQPVQLFFKSTTLREIKQVKETQPPLLRFGVRSNAQNSTLDPHGIPSLPLPVKVTIHVPACSDHLLSLTGRPVVEVQLPCLPACGSTDETDEDCFTVRVSMTPASAQPFLAFSSLLFVET